MIGANSLEMALQNDARPADYRKAMAIGRNSIHVALADIQADPST